MNPIHAAVVRDSPFKIWNSEYCSPPREDNVLDLFNNNVTNGFFGVMSDSFKWKSRYPLVYLDIVTPDILASHTVNAYFCSFGWTFIAEMIMGFVLFALSAGCLIWIQAKLGLFSHKFRQFLFLLIALTGLVRGLYNAIVVHKVQSLERYVDVLGISYWFFKTNVPSNIAADLLTVYVDFVLTLFWFDVVIPVTRSPVSRVFQGVAFFLAPFVALFVTLSLDYADIIHENFNGGNIYKRSLSCLAAVMLLSGLLHIVSVGLLVAELRRMGALSVAPAATMLNGLPGPTVSSAPLLNPGRDSMINTRAPYSQLQRPQTVLHDKRMRTYLFWVSMISFISAVCLVVRAVAVAGRVAWDESFLSGWFGFDNPWFTTAYYIGLMNLPCAFVAVAFLFLTLELVKARETRLNDEARNLGASVVLSSKISNPNGRMTV